MCQTPGFNWTQSMVLDFAYCGAAYLDGLSVNGSLHSFSHWTSDLTNNLMQCDHFPSTDSMDCQAPVSTDYCGNSSIPTGLYQALWMVSTLYYELKAMKDAFEQAGVVAQDSIPGIINDFALPSSGRPLTSIVLSSLGGAISTVGGLMGEFGLPFTAAGYIVGLMVYVPTATSSGTSLDVVLSNYTGEFLTQSSNAISEAATAIFETGTLENVPLELTKDTGGNGFTVPIANFFYNVAPVMQPETSQNNEIQNNLITDLERGLVGAALRAGNYSLLKNSTDAADCNTTTGNLPYTPNGLCYTLQAPGNACAYGVGRQATNLPLSQVQLLTGKYSVNWTDLIESSEGCQNGDATPVGNMPFSYKDLTWSSTQHSPCFFQFGVLSIDYDFYSQDACQIWEVNTTAAAGTTPVLGSTYLPDYLNGIFDTQFCSCPTTGCAKRDRLGKRTVC